ncbi:S-adenosyl-L-methionine-dependent methyltransferase [Chiua virens]|nr:S-adenosyl-L-methionine-dependent methyltransferase [Chiua virens]
MATFGKTNFNTTVYAASRPTYPPALYDFIFDFHKGSPDAKFDRAVDLGCGTGQATIELTHFKHVTGLDPSENMIHAAREMLANSDSQPGPIVDFVQGSAETLDFLPDDSTDMVIAAQAGHWFDWTRMWPELARVMRKGATAAFWIYSEFRLPQYPALTPLIVAYDQGTDPHKSVGPYWQQPGRSILINHLVGIPDGNSVVPDAFEPFERVYFTGEFLVFSGAEAHALRWLVGEYYPELPGARPVVLRRVMSWDDLLGYLKTWSALHTFKEHHPSDSAHPDGPLEVRFWKALRAGVERGGEGVPDEVVVEWPVAMVLARKAT